MIKVDCHLHTMYSPDASKRASFESYCEQALLHDVKVLTFTDHIDVYGQYESYSAFDFCRRNADFEQAKAKYGKYLTLLYGLEFGEPNHDGKLFDKVVNAYPYDFILGSVHYPCDLYGEGGCSYDEMRKLHYELTMQMVSKGGFDSLAHLDFPKKFFGNWQGDADKEEQILKVLIAKDISLEINTSSLRKGLSDPCPSYATIQRYAALGGKYVTLGSDSHVVDTLCADYGEVLSKLPQGLKVCYYVARTRVTL